MKQIFRKSTAILLVLVQLLVLFPVLLPQAKAVQTEPDTVPALNKTIVGTVKFQSFNFLGDNVNGVDGTDYTSTFIYTDDYFAHSAVNENVNSKSVPWTELDDTSLAACSMDFAVASYTSAEGDVIRASSQSWNNTDYSAKDKNVKEFLSTCGFTNIQPFGLTQAPTMDSIGYTIASKPITVWDGQQNKSFTLIAVGVRGAGYGAEWASNVTIGTPGSGANVVRHEGFDNGAKTICRSIRDYLSDYGITGDVKYWVAGFSRAAAVANLTAGYLTDDPATYKTSRENVYGYTYECPQAASTNENALNYKNIHNILNAMDAVPKVSPTKFQHQRLGVDYVMPYYDNTSSSTQNTTYYNRMKEVLQTICVGNGSETDPLLDAINNYPYNRTLPIYTMTATQLIADALGGNLTTNFGTVTASDGLFGNVDSILGGNQWYMDDFIDNLIDVFLTSSAWDRGATATTNVITHRTRFINNYQEEFRTALGYMLDFSGPAFLGLVDKVLSAVGNSLGISDAGMGLAFLNFYNDPKGSYASYNLLVDRSWRGKPKKDVLITEAQVVVKDVVTNMTSGYSHNTITRARMNQALDTLTSVIIDLYADELDRYDAQYFGTSLHWLWEILATHEQETVISWIKSLDDNFISDVRKITLPQSADVDLYVFREGLEGTLTPDAAEAARAQGSLVARVRSGAFVPLTGADGRSYDRLDDRITLAQSGSNIVIAYPGTMDLRLDVQGTYADLPLQLTDLQPSSTVNTKSTATRDSKGHITATQIVTDSMVQQGNTPTARAINTFSNGNAIELAAGETLSVIAWHGSNQVMDARDASYALYKTTPKTVLIDFSGNTVVAENETLMSGSSANSGTFAQSGSDVTYALRSGTESTFRSSAFSDTDYARADDPAATGTLRRGESITTVPASSIYYDDDLAGQTITSDGHGYSADINDLAVSRSAAAVSGTFYYTFYGSGIDAYCTTDSESGYVSAAVFRGAGAEACVKANRVGSAQTVSSKTAGSPKYNTPTIGFMDLGGQDTYTLKIVANDGAKFKLDGVRVYHPVQADSAAAEAQAEAGEGNVLYLNLHELLLNADQGFSVQKPGGMDDSFDQSAISGVLFIDDADALVTESHYDADGVWHEEMTQLYATQFEAYRANSPKNEIYLAAKNGDQTQAITFQVNTAKAPVGSTIYIGMSAPETGSGEVSVTGSGSKPVTSVMDMYYGVTVPSNGLIRIENVGESLISLTNLKIPNVPEAKSVRAMPAPEKIFAMRAFFAPVTTETVELAAAQETETVTVQPDPTPSSIADLISQLISGFVQNLFSAFARLFGH